MFWWPLVGPKTKVFILNRYTNTGNVPHNFESESQGIEEGLESNLQSGETGELAVCWGDNPGRYAA
jgi:hypothetical protein